MKDLIIHVLFLRTNVIPVNYYWFSLTFSSVYSSHIYIYTHLKGGPFLNSDTDQNMDVTLQIDKISAVSWRSHIIELPLREKGVLLFPTAT